jgi:outer membrane lipoprotein LolB
VTCLKILLNDLIPGFNLLLIQFFRLDANKMRCYTSPLAIYFKRINLVLIGIILMVSGCAIQPPITDLEKTRHWETKKLILNKLNVRIVAPLSQGSVEINGDANTVNLKTSDEQVYANQDVDLLMQQNLGWSIPVSVMQYWIKGLPAPDLNIDKIILDDMGNMDVLIQSNWHITYQAYSRSGGYDLPSRLQITRDDLNIRLSINSWTISDGN